MVNKDRIIAAFVCMMLVISTVFTAYAADQSLPSEVKGEELVDKVIEKIVKDGNYSETEETKIIEDIEIIDAFGLDLNQVKPIKDLNENIGYKYELSGGKAARIIPSEIADGIVLDIDEGNVHNKVLLTKDNRMFIDGYEVTVNETVYEDVVFENELEFSKSSTWDQLKNPCPKKNWVYKSTYTEKTVKMGQTFKAIGAVALALVMTHAGILASTLTTIAGALDNIGDIWNPSSTSFSCIVKVYYPKGGQNIGNGQYVKKKCGTFYTLPNHQGHKTTQTWYTIKEYY